MTRELWNLGAIETASQIASGTVSASDVIEAHLARLDLLNPVLNAITRPLHKTAREAAKQADLAVARGSEIGPLHGVPVTIKDNVDIAGQSSPNGLKVLDDIIAESNSPVVDNLLAAGAIPIGRTNTPEFSLRLHTENPLFGATINPWDPERTPGGSSGGASASLAAGIGCLAHGNDLGGSLRQPAYCTGLCTIRPTQGRIPAFNPTAKSERPPAILQMSTQGPIARSVADTRLGLSVMAKRDIRDPWWVPAPIDGPGPKTPMHVALVRTPPGTPMDACVTDALDRAGQFLSDAGYVVEDLHPPEIERCAEVWAGLLMTETRMLMTETIRELGSESINRSLGFFDQMTPEYDLQGYLALMSERTRLLRVWLAFLEDVPLIVGPVSNIAPFRPNEDISTQDKAERIFYAHRLLVTINLLGLPSAVVPTGLQDGLPSGVQIIATRYREDLALNAAQAVEDRVGQLTPINPGSGK